MSKSMPNSINPGKKSQESYEAAALDKIRQTGICRYYEQLKSQGVSPEECLKKTGEFGRLSERQTKGILYGNVQKTGQKPNRVSEYLEEIEMVHFKPSIPGKKRKGRTYPEIQNAIEKDPNLNAVEKQSLKAMIDRAMSEAKARSSTNKAPSEGRQFRSIADVVGNLDAHPPETDTQSFEEAIKKFDSCK